MGIVLRCNDNYRAGIGDMVCIHYMNDMGIDCCCRTGKISDINDTYVILDTDEERISIEMSNITEVIRTYPDIRYKEYDSSSDKVNHPSHYKSETGLEAIDAIEAFTFDLKGIEAFDTGNALKYMCRWKKKNGLEDLKKAQWYLNHLIKHVENLEKENELS